jgi:hypothetical protein
MDRELTVSEARKLKLPDADPINGEEVVWAEPPARRKDFDEAARLLGGDRKAA